VGQGSGCFLTLEWPMTRLVEKDGATKLEFRPGYRLAPGQTVEVTVGSLGCFAACGTADDVDAARLVFFDHLRRRIQPRVPNPIKFTTWGPWWAHATEQRVREIVADLEWVGTDLLHWDAGWQSPFYPYSLALPAARDADDAVWDRAVSHPDRLPVRLESSMPCHVHAPPRGTRTFAAGIH